MKKLFWFCFWFLFYVSGVIAQPSVGLINTETTGPMGIGPQLMEQVHLIKNEIADTTWSADTTCFSTFPLQWYPVEYVEKPAPLKLEKNIFSTTILKIAFSILFDIPGI